MLHTLSVSLVHIPPTSPPYKTSAPSPTTTKLTLSLSTHRLNHSDTLESLQSMYSLSYVQLLQLNAGRIVGNSDLVVGEEVIVGIVGGEEQSRKRRPISIEERADKRLRR